VTPEPRSSANLERGGEVERVDGPAIAGGRRCSSRFLANNRHDEIIATTLD